MSTPAPSGDADVPTETPVPNDAAAANDVSTSSVLADDVPEPPMSWPRWMWEFLVALVVSVVITGVVLLTPLVLLFGGSAVWARVNTTTVYWPDPTVVAMRERTEQGFLPPPGSTFASGSVTTHHDRDTSQCIAYRTTANANSARAYYDAFFRAKGWLATDNSYLSWVGRSARGPYNWHLGVSGAGGILSYSEERSGWFFTVERPRPTVEFCYAYPYWLRNVPISPGGLVNGL